MPQVLAVADFKVEFRDYLAGQVIIFSDQGVIDHLRLRGVINVRALDVAAAVLAGAPVVAHERAAPLKSGRLQARSTCTLLGDSLFAVGNVPSYGPGAQGGAFSDSHVVWANDMLNASGSGIDVTSVRAVGGKTVEQVVSEQLPGALTDPTDIAWVHAGANSLNTTVGTGSVAATLASMEVLVGALSRGKRLVIVDAVQPVYQAGSTGLKPRAAQIPVLNAGIQSICRRYPNVVFNDVYTPLLDPENANLDALSGALNVADGIHFRTIGAQIAGYASAANILSVAEITSAYKKGPNLLPAFSGSGGTTTPGAGAIVGTPPVGWNVAIPAGAASVVVSEPQNGVTRLAITNAGAAASVVYLQVSDAAALQSAIGGGACTLRGQCTFQASGIAANTNRVAAVMVIRNGDQIWTGGGEDQAFEGTANMRTQIFGGVRSTPPMRWLAGAAAANFVIALKVGATTGAITFDVTAPELVKLF